MPPKHLKTNGKGDVVDNPIVRSKTKPTPYREPDWLREHRLKRERYFWKKFPEQRAWIEEFVNEMKKNWLTQDKRK